MLTLQCRIVLKNLKKLTNNTEINVSYLSDDCYFCLDDMSQLYSYKKYEREIDSIISQLVASGYLQYNYGNAYNFHLTQKGLHNSFLTLQSMSLFFVKNFLLPIVISIITTLITLRIKGQL